MGKVKVNFYKTIAGRDRLITTRYFNSLAEAFAVVEAWEELTADNYAVFA